VAQERQRYSPGSDGIVREELGEANDRAGAGIGIRAPASQAKGSGRKAGELATELRLGTDGVAAAAAVRLACERRMASAASPLASVPPPTSTSRGGVYVRHGRFASMARASPRETETAPTIGITYR